MLVTLHPPLPSPFLLLPHLEHCKGDLEEIQRVRRKRLVLGHPVQDFKHLQAGGGGRGGRRCKIGVRGQSQWQPSLPTCCSFWTKDTQLEDSTLSPPRHTYVLPTPLPSQLGSPVSPSPPPHPPSPPVP